MSKAKGVGAGVEKKGEVEAERTAITSPPPARFKSGTLLPNTEGIAGKRGAGILVLKQVN